MKCINVFDASGARMMNEIYDDSSVPLATEISRIKTLAFWDDSFTITTSDTLNAEEQAIANERQLRTTIKNRAATYKASIATAKTQVNAVDMSTVTSLATAKTVLTQLQTYLSNQCDFMSQFVDDINNALQKML